MRFLCLAAAAAMTIPTAPLAAQSVKAGIDAWQKADYAAAVDIWRPLAEKGDLDAAFNLGQAYRLGRGVTINLAAAQTWLERAARKGHLDAQTTLGLMLFQNGNQVSGLRWLGQAAERGDARAMLIYGTALFNGDSLPRDPVLGYAYVSRAAAQGLPPAKATLAELDQILPLDQRKKAVTLAIAKAKAAPPPSTAVKAKSAAKPPTQAAAPAAPSPTPTAGGAWRIQLGAFSQRGAAEALYRKVAGALPGRAPFYVAAGPVTRLQVGPYPSRAAAQAACNSLKDQACFPVTAK
ncbi:SPOR domain-containing protein [Sphingomonas lutea]|uniref:SPOR domain-containing protein n=1 Tax=Sphingomonas lutea TaxID=1045317 RepID=A0A7G9SF43_9SPHN|nr:SPOR domain-containing protein [Sphingomonas lutea]QNN66468.1 SPOR domain-containing protein [Sphingomonas lutea]